VSVTLLRGNALTLPLADDSVDLIVTSPPYFGLRSYTDGGEHYAGQLGSEPTPAEFLDALIAATRDTTHPGKAGLWDRPKVGPWREYHFDRWTPAPTRPAVVLDVFGGTGTTALVADALGRHGISLDMSADYCRLARWRTTDPGQRAAAMQVEKPPPVPAGHGDGHDLLSLLDGEATA
jgi:hypothetical protein